VTRQAVGSRAEWLAPPGHTLTAGMGGIPWPAKMAPNAEVGHLLGIFEPDTAKEVFITGEIAQRLAADAPDNLAFLLGFFRQPIDVTAALLAVISNAVQGLPRKKSAACRSRRW
jgi:hypothetical protein